MAYNSLIVGNAPLDLATTRLWLQALNDVASLNPGDARTVQRDLADPLNQIAEYIAMVRSSPEHVCTPFELTWRRRFLSLASTRLAST